MNSLELPTALGAKLHTLTHALQKKVKDNTWNILAYGAYVGIATLFVTAAYFGSIEGALYGSTVLTIALSGFGFVAWTMRDSGKK